jgi:hypothetical protein
MTPKHKLQTITERRLQNDRRFFKAFLIILSINNAAVKCFNEQYTYKNAQLD